MVRTTFGISLYGSSTVLILAYIVLCLPHCTRMIMSGMAQINPQLEAAARVFGSTGLGAVMRVLVPLLRRHLVSAAMLMFMLSSNEFPASALLVGPDTQVMSTVLYGQWDTGTYPRVAALALVMVAIAIAGLGRHRGVRSRQHFRSQRTLAQVIFAAEGSMSSFETRSATGIQMSHLSSRFVSPPTIDCSTSGEVVR